MTETKKVFSPGDEVSFEYVLHSTYSDDVVRIVRGKGKVMRAITLDNEPAYLIRRTDTEGYGDVAEVYASDISQ
jgi:hypothetical protein